MQYIQIILEEYSKTLKISYILPKLQSSAPLFLQTGLKKTWLPKSLLFNRLWTVKVFDGEHLKAKESCRGRKEESAPAS